MLSNVLACDLVLEIVSTDFTIEVSSLLYSRRSSNVLKKSENRQNYSQVPQPSKDKALQGWKSLHRSLGSDKDTKLVSESFLSCSQTESASVVFLNCKRTILIWPCREGFPLLLYPSWIFLI